MKLASIYLPQLLLCLLCSLTKPLWGQARLVGPLDPTTQRVTYTAVVPVAGVSQADLLLRARAWSEQATSAGQPPVITRGPAGEVIRTTGICPFAYYWNGQALLSTLRYTATLSVRDNIYQYAVTDFVFVEPSSPSGTPVETYYDGSFKPLRDAGVQFQVARRTCFQEIAGEVLLHLQAVMHKPAREEKPK